jgi:hypothetical protein
MDNLNCSADYIDYINGMHKYYGQSLDSFSAQAWVDMSHEFGEDAVKAACLAHIRTPVDGKWLPKLADIIGKLSGGAKSQGQQAWSKFISAVRHYGIYSSVCFDDPAIHIVARDMGGWTSFGSKTDDELPFVERDFVDRYKAVVSTLGGVKDWPSKLIGLIEAENHANGRHTDERYLDPGLVLIGKQDEALKVYQKGLEHSAAPATLVDISKLLSDISSKKGTPIGFLSVAHD